MRIRSLWSRHRCKVLIVTPWYGGANGGVAISTESLAGALVRRGVGVLVAVLDRRDGKRFERGRHGELLLGLTSYGPEVRRLGVKGRLGYYRRALESGLTVAYVVVRYGVRIVHFQYAVPGFTPIQAWLRILHVPFIVTFHGSDVHQAALGSEAARRIDSLIRSANLVTAISDGLLRDLEKRSPHARGTTHVVPNGIPIDIWDSAADPDLCAKRDIDVLFVGNLRFVKGPDFLVEAFRVLISLRPSTSLVFVGSGDMDEQLRLRVREAGLEAHVIFAGRVGRTDIADYYRRARVLAVPSRAEGFSLVAAEAQLFGVPVVATAVGGLPQTVCDGQTGTLVPFGDTAAFVAAFCGLLDDEGQWVRASNRARTWAREHFSPDVMAARFDDLYDRVLQTAQRSVEADVKVSAPDSTGSTNMLDS